MCEGENSIEEIRRLYDQATDGLDSVQLKRVIEGLNEEDENSCRMQRARELHLVLLQMSTSEGIAAMAD